MKIERIETIVVDTGKGRTWAFVEIKTDDGLIGVGEASQSRLDAAVVTQVKALEPLYLGHDPFELIENRARLLRRPDAGRILHVAVSSLEQALWDLVGKALGQPVHRLLGGAVRSEIPLYANVAMAAESWTPEPIAKWVRAAVDQGFSAVKFNILPIDAGRGGLKSHGAFRKAMDQAVAIVREARAAAGPEVRLLTDWSLAISAKDAVRLAEALEPYDLLWIEEPFVLGDPAELVAFRRLIKPRLTIGEQLLKAADFRALLEARAADCIMPDVKWLGGILECRKVAAMAEAFGVEIAPHNMSGPVATAASAAFSAGAANLLILEYCFGVPDWRAELVDGTERIVNGALELATAPGLGLAWNGAAARKRAIRV